jgi:hypothetical protein
MPACLADPFEGDGLIVRLGGKIVEFLEQRDRDGKESPALLLGVSKPAVELVGPVDDRLPSPGNTTSSS